MTSPEAMLDKHVRSVHLKERPYSCHLCDKRFGQKVHLEVHMSGVHMKERPYGKLMAVALSCFIRGGIDSGDNLKVRPHIE